MNANRISFGCPFGPTVTGSGCTYPVGGVIETDMSKNEIVEAIVGVTPQA
jgi:hypothetical protein